MSREDQKAVDRITDDAPFEVPSFDEKDFIRKELISFKTTLVLFVVSVLVAAATFAVWTVVDPHPLFLYLALGALAIGAGSLRFIFKAAGIDVSHWARKEWIGTMFLYAFFWLGFFLLFVNPPFTDAAAPVVEVAAVPAAQAPNGTVALGAYIADNAGLQAGSATFCMHPYAGATPPPYADLSEAQRTACATSWERKGNDPFWTTSASFTPGKYVVYATAADKEGQLTIGQTTFEISSPFVGNVGLPRDGRFAVPDDSLSVRLKNEVYARVVQFRLDNEDVWHDMVPHPDATKRAENYWRTDPSYEGWAQGTHDVTIRVLPQPVYMRGADRVLKAEGVDPNGPYRLTVDALPGIGATKANLGRPYAEFSYTGGASTPGIGVPVLLTSFVGLAFLGRRRSET